MISRKLNTIHFWFYLPEAQMKLKQRYIETIQAIGRNDFFADTIWISETYIGNARFVKSL